MAGKLADLFVNIGAKTDDFKKGLNDVKSEGTSLGSTIGKVGGIIAGAFAVGTIAAFSSEIAKMAAISEGVEAAFKRFGSESQLEGLRKATRGTVSDLELMKAAVQAQNFGIPLQNLGSLLEFAHQRAKDTGQSVDYLVNSIVVGIGRKSPLILDNLGISAVQLKEKMKGVGAETATVGDVAKAVGEIASEAMAKVGKSAETTAEKTASVGAAWDNFKVALGSFVNYIVSVLAPLLTTFLNNLTGGLKSAKKVIDEAKQSVNESSVNNALTYISDLEKSYKSKGLFKGDERQKAYEAYYNNARTTYDALLKEIKEGTTEEQKWARVKIEALVAEIEGVNKIFNKKEEIADVDNKDLEITKEKVKQLTLWEKIQKNIKDAADQREQMSFWTPRELVAPSAIKGKSTGLIPQVEGFQTGADQLSKFANSFHETANVVNESVLEMSSSIGQFVEDFASGIGELLAGTATFDDFGKMILKSVGNFMSSLGKQMIALGVAKIAADTLLAVPGGGVGLIVAGAALVALGGAVNSTLSSSPMSSGSHGSSSSYHSTGLSNKNNTIEIEGQLKGTDIYWSLKRTGNKLANTSS